MNSTKEPQRSVCPCGANCTKCEHYPDPCGGCRVIRGKVWWLTYTGQDVCPFYACCIEKKRLPHCGKCDAFPCEIFRQGDPTKTDAENAAILQAQIDALTKEVIS